MKKLLSILLLLLVIIFTIACSEEPPSVRVKNERINKVNVQFKQGDGNTININDITSGTLSGYKDIKEGSTLVTAVIQSEQVSPTVGFSALNDMKYTVVVLNSTPPTIRIDSQEK